MPLPSSTYRLQLTAQFTFGEAAAVCDYLQRLGVGWVYLSPVLRAEPHSLHGYDVIDHATIDPERGGQEAFDAFCAAAHRAGLGVLVDIVPNHMGVATPRMNAWWWDLLGRGHGSKYSDAFDVDWDAGGGKIRIPVLGDGDDELDHLVIDGDELVYYENRYPIAPGTRLADDDSAAEDDSAADVHARQHYELVNWRRADDELNYRRFFAVNTLAGIRVEVPWVFDSSHAQIGRWFREHLVDGLRVDHPDGLADPRAYLDRLSALTAGAPVWVEKILEGDEALPADWATAGTTGYDALGDFDRVLVDERGRAGLARAQQRLGAARDHSADSASVDDWAEMVLESKHAIASGILCSEFNRLARLMPEIQGAAEALIELAAAFPVYRSYLPFGAQHLRRAHHLARSRRPELAQTIDAAVAVLGDPRHPAAVRFQQTSGMVMAKGVEDSAFYGFNTLTSLNEVGGDPSEFAIDVTTFHRRQAGRQNQRPAAMTTLSTHDTKRGEDTRARITALAERPELWESALTRLRNAADLEDPALENLIWQAVIGAWPASRDRLHGYAEKAAREAGNSTNWLSPDAGFEKRLHAAIDAAFDDASVAAVIRETVQAIGPAGRSNGLSAKLLQLAGPGIPDVYQGSELWEQSLVDPDNRRPVDFADRARLLASIDAGDLPAVDETGAAKLLVTSRVLRLRRSHPEFFLSYRALELAGEMSDHGIAFDRGGAIAVATRLPYTLARAGGWGETTIELPRGEQVDLLTGRSFSGSVTRMSDLLQVYPVGLLVLAGEQ
ncbi:malto-oligosyltrehalose synthase [Homoserinimonas sp. OAct 916]|uniref:malto-oligosyltrehalose synthase n=1 Tax=Homoserinimonas sp. OAct 916 TaxID=2211450 RepID=UPI000DBE0CCA|nr:malto-oligosyltrehalose synthase [Homoserinimonas sp. OAct 916]